MFARLSEPASQQDCTLCDDNLSCQTPPEPAQQQEVEEEEEDDDDAAVRSSEKTEKKKNSSPDECYYCPLVGLLFCIIDNRHHSGDNQSRRSCWFVFLFFPRFSSNDYKSFHPKRHLIFTARDCEAISGSGRQRRERFWRRKGKTADETRTAGKIRSDCVSETRTKKLAMVV